MAQKTLPWQPILVSKLEKIGQLIIVRRLGIPRRLGILPFLLHFDF